VILFWIYGWLQRTEGSHNGIVSAPRESGILRRGSMQRRMRCSKQWVSVHGLEVIYKTAGEQQNDESLEGGFYKRWKCRNCRQLAISRRCRLTCFPLGRSVSDVLPHLPFLPLRGSFLQRLASTCKLKSLARPQTLPLTVHNQSHLFWKY
jgi:hypothetical protein